MIAVGKVLLLGCALVALSQTLPLEDQVEYIEQMEDLSFGMYSGYVQINDTQKELHYVASLSQNNYTTDPVIIWLNGGPGCSSLFGWSMEIGPYVMGDEDIYFQQNQYAWNKNASLIFIEMPAGVGFSICRDQSECESYDDETTTKDAFIAILNLFTQKFPELQTNDLYITGESYAGIYIPYIANFIDEWNSSQNGTYKPNLKGFMIGNGVTNYKYDILPATFKTLYEHFFISDDMYRSVLGNCTADDLSNIEADSESISMECLALVNDVYNIIFDSRINPYNMYGKCYGDNKLGSPTLYESKSEFFLQDGAEVQEMPLRKGFSPLQYTPWFYPKILQRLNGKKLRSSSICQSGDEIVEYLNRSPNRRALHIPNEVGMWEFCSDDVGNSYHANFTGTQWIYSKLRHKYRMLKFSGDVDAVVPTLGTIQWINDLDWQVKENLRPYFLNGQVAGYIEERDGLTFATIRGAGHAAPQYKREESYHLIFNWLNNQKI